MKGIILVITTVLVLASCKSTYHECDAYGVNSISNPENAEFVEEVAFNEGIPASSVTQAQFNARYK